MIIFSQEIKVSYLYLNFIRCKVIAQFCTTATLLIMRLPFSSLLSNNSLLLSLSLSLSVFSSQIITTNKPTPNFLQAGCPSCRPTNSIKALNGKALKGNAPLFYTVNINLLICISVILSPNICIIKYAHNHRGVMTI